ncbi:MAG: SMI1/KNR4 family protein [Candidatus Sericytochromatia bacterium]
MSVPKHLDAIKQWHATQGSPTAKAFQPALTPEQIAKRTRELPFSLSEEVQKLYLWHNGLKDNAPLFRNFTFFPLGDAVEEYLLACETAEEMTEAEEGPFWKPTWFPLFGFHGDFLFVDFAPKAGRSVWSRTGSEAPVRWYDSVERLLLTVRTCFEKKAYFFDDDEILSEDWEKANKIREQLNPRAEKIKPDIPEPIRQEMDAQPDGTRRLTTWYSEDHYIEQFYGPDDRKIGQCEYAQGQLMQREDFHYPTPTTVEITSEGLMGMGMTTKTHGRILPDGSVERTLVQTYMQGQLMMEQDLTVEDGFRIPGMPDMDLFGGNDEEE